MHRANGTRSMVGKARLGGKRDGSNGAAQADPRTSGSPKKVRYAVVGLGYIAQAAVLPAFAHARENSELAALVSGDPKKLSAMGRKYKIAPQACYDYEHYADCLMSGKIDAVYIALPNHLHKEYAEPAAWAGQHVLCEKPMAVNVAECDSMIQTAQDAGVKLMIAYRLHFERGNLEAIKMVNDGTIGEPRIFSSTFTQQVPARNSRLRRDEFGFALYDMGTYCINAARYLFRAEPEEVFAWNLNNGDERFREIPEMTSAMMKFPGERIATFTASFGAEKHSVYEVIGTSGALRMDPAYSMSGPIAGELTVGKKKTKLNYPKRDQFAAELSYFSDCVLKNQEPEPSGQEGLADVRVIRALLESVKTGLPVKVGATAIANRPSLSQEIQKPPVREPELVRAGAPSR